MPQVLYIEDNSDNRMLVRRVLMASDYDFTVVEADSAYKGIEMARAKPPDLILMDLSMPEMDGLTATKRIRTLPELGDVVIVALTANAMDSDRDRSLDAGCDGYIRKPIDVDKFADEVFSFIRSRHERRSKQQPADHTADADLN
jgi:two-component system cell cycle response regulator DivK